MVEIGTEHQYDYEIMIIGAGPGGYETAIRAAQQGKRVGIVESTYFGGTCLNVGCIPTKALIKGANALSEAKEAAEFAVTGIDPTQLGVDMKALQKRKNTVVNALVSGVRGLLKDNKVTAIEGHAAFMDHHTIQVGVQRITSEYFIIATGSSVFIPPFIAQEGSNHLLTSTEALNLNELPQSVAVIGGGVIGIEFAYLLNKLGCRVTVLELTETILPMVDPEVSKMAQKRLQQDGIQFYLGAKVEKIKDNAVYYSVNGAAATVAAEAILMAVGRIPNTDGLGVEKIGLAMNKRAIETDGRMRTNLTNIYAIGDVNGKVMLAHTASHEGHVAVENICHQRDATMNYQRIPSCIYLKPEIACIGLTEEQAKATGANVKIGRFQMRANGKSLVEGDTDGLFKVILDGDTGEILGAHLYGLHVTDMIGEIATAMTGELTAEEMLEVIHAHPTVSEALGEAFLSAWCGRAVNSL